MLGRNVLLAYAQDVECRSQDRARITLKHRGKKAFAGLSVFGDIRKERECRDKPGKSVKLSTSLRKSSRPHGAKTYSDLAITRRIYQTIEDRLKAADIGGLQFYVREGSVSVYGAVGGEQRRELIVSLLSQIPGVRSIDFQIQVVNRKTLELPVSQRNRNHHSA